MFARGEAEGDGADIIIFNTGGIAVNGNFPAGVVESMEGQGFRGKVFDLRPEQERIGRSDDDFCIREIPN